MAAREITVWRTIASRLSAGWGARPPAGFGGSPPQSLPRRVLGARRACVRFCLPVWRAEALRGRRQVWRRGYLERRAGPSWDGGGLFRGPIRSGDGASRPCTAPGALRPLAKGRTRACWGFLGRAGHAGEVARLPHRRPGEIEGCAGPGMRPSATMRPSWQREGDAPGTEKRLVAYVGGPRSVFVGGMSQTWRSTWGQEPGRTIMVPVGVRCHWERGCADNNVARRAALAGRRALPRSFRRARQSAGGDSMCTVRRGDGDRKRRASTMIYFVDRRSFSLPPPG